MHHPRILGAVLSALLAVSFSNASESPRGSPFEFKADRFADIQVLRYRVPGFEQLSLQQKTLAYYLYEAGLSGRDIFYDQKYRHQPRGPQNARDHPPQLPR